MNIEFRKDGRGRDVMCIGEAKTMGKPFSDFGGTESNGVHHFKIEIPADQVDIFKNFGFEPYYLDGKDGKYDPKWILDIVLGFKFGDPGVFLVAYNGVKTQLKEEMLGDLDNRDNIAYADVELYRHYWKMNGREGFKPYGSKLHIYLAGPSYAEQRYLERYGDVAVERTPIPTPEPVQDTFIPVEDEDIPF